MSPKGKWIPLIALGLALLSVAGCARSRESDAPASAAPASDPFALEEGGRLYGRYCFPCHGQSGQGDGRFFASSLQPTPADFTDPGFRNSHGERQLRDIIREGSASVGKSDLCPPWGKTFTATEVEYLIAYIGHLQHKRETASLNTSP